MAPGDDGWLGHGLVRRNLHDCLLDPHHCRAVFLIKWLVQSSRESPSGRSSPTSRALHILEERYARGEIDKQEFLDKKKDLLS
jgi:hypothetical protein